VLSFDAIAFKNKINSIEFIDINHRLHCWFFDFILDKVDKGSIFSTPSHE